MVVVLFFLCPQALRSAGPRVRFVFVGNGRRATERDTGVSQRGMYVFVAAVGKEGVKK